jgi:site-specific DNA-methyltransferase (adenine-specific)
MLKKLPDSSIDCCVTSPPYWALRDYGMQGQLGLEQTFQEYIARLCDVFDEIKRVLKPEGTCWVNLGDTYSTVSGRQGKPDLYGKQPKFSKGADAAMPEKIRTDYPDKCLLQIPSRFAIEMTDRGWILRNEIIWHKPNCMPQSVKDRFTSDFEKIFFFVKKQKYWFETQFEPFQDDAIKKIFERNAKFSGQKARRNGRQQHRGKAWTSDMGGGGTSFVGHSGYYKADGTLLVNPRGRNRRCVWRVPTKPFKKAHFAVYPEALIETPIKAGCPVGGIVLDPFFGSGTTGVVAQRLGRDYLGIELNPEYIEIAERRLS